MQIDIFHSSFIFLLSMPLPSPIVGINGRKCVNRILILPSSWYDRTRVRRVLHSVCRLEWRPEIKWILFELDKISGLVRTHGSLKYCKQLPFWCFSKLPTLIIDAYVSTHHVNFGTSHQISKLLSVFDVYIYYSWNSGYQIKSREKSRIHLEIFWDRFCFVVMTSNRICGGQNCRASRQGTNKSWNEIVQLWTFLNFILETTNLNNVYFSFYFRYKPTAKSCQEHREYLLKNSRKFGELQIFYSYLTLQWTLIAVPWPPRGRCVGRSSCRTRRYSNTLKKDIFDWNTVKENVVFLS